ncbi:unnamed protein product [Sphacelaria rigidula]
MTNHFFTGKSSKKSETPRGSGNYAAFAATSSGAPSGSGSGSLHNPNGYGKTSSPQDTAPEKTGTGPSPTAMMPPSNGQHKAPTSSQKALSLLDQKPESMVAETLKMKGELEFTRLLRVDGRFEGDLITDNGSLVVGPKGEVVGDLKNMKEVYVEGIVRGNVFASEVKVKNNGMLFGDIQCLQLTLDPTASVKGVADTATLKERAIQEKADAKKAAAAAAAASNAASSNGAVTKPPSAAPVASAAGGMAPTYASGSAVMTAGERSIAPVTKSRPTRIETSMPPPS